MADPTPWPCANGRLHSTSPPFFFQRSSQHPSHLRRANLVFWLCRSSAGRTVSSNPGLRRRMTDVRMRAQASSTHIPPDISSLLPFNLVFYVSVQTLTCMREESIQSAYIALSLLTSKRAADPPPGYLSNLPCPQCPPRFVSEPRRVYSSRCQDIMAPRAGRPASQASAATSRATVVVPFLKLLHEEAVVSTARLCGFFL